MAINKLPEFAKDGQKNTDDLNLTDGFPVSKKPARQWFNYLFNMLSLKINEIIESDPVTRSEIVDNLTTDDATKPLSAKQGKDLQDNKLDKNANAVSASKLQTARTIGGVSFDGTANINLPGVNTAGNQDTSGNAATATKLATDRTINGVSFNGTSNINLPLLGYGQAWQNVKSSRNSGVVYTNTTGKPIQLFICANFDAIGKIEIDGISLPIYDQEAYGFIFVVIPAGSTYKVTVTSTALLQTWAELR